jgi:hypothetical protein
MLIVQRLRERQHTASHQGRWCCSSFVPWVSPWPFIQDMHCFHALFSTVFSAEQNKASISTAERGSIRGNLPVFPTHLSPSLPPSARTGVKSARFYLDQTLCYNTALYTAVWILKRNEYNTFINHGGKTNEHVIIQSHSPITSSINIQQQIDIADQSHYKRTLVTLSHTHTPIIITTMTITPWPLPINHHYHLDQHSSQLSWSPLASRGLECGFLSLVSLLSPPHHHP